MKRLAWTALLLFTALLVIAVELDRSSRKDPQLASTVPRPFQSFALASIVMNHPANDDPGSALEMAKALVRKRPIPAEHLRALAVADQTLGNEAAASQALMVAAGRGWRDPVVQASMVIAGSGTGQWDVAAQRLAALWATSGDKALVDSATKQVMRSAPGRRALAAVLASNVPANDGILRWISVNAPLGDAGGLIVDAQHRGARFACPGLSRLSRALVQADRPALAAAVWTRDCSQASFVRGNDLQFLTPADENATGPFDWSFPRTENISSDLVEQNGQMVLELQNSAAVQLEVASKFSALSSGVHRIGLRASHRLKPSKLEVEVVCVRTKTVLATVGLSDEKTFVVPEGCVVQRVALRAAPGSYDGVYLTGK